MTDEFVLLCLETLLALSKANLCPGEQDSNWKLPRETPPLLPMGSCCAPSYILQTLLGVVSLCLRERPRLLARGRHTCFDFIKREHKYVCKCSHLGKDPLLFPKKISILQSNSKHYSEPPASPDLIIDNKIIHLPCSAQ